MRKMYRAMRIAGVVVVGLALALAAVACGSAETAAEDTTTTIAASTETSEAPEAAEGKNYKIGITQIVAHPALDSTAQGFIDALAEAGYVEGQNVTFDIQNAQGEMSNASTIAQKFAGDNVDLVLSIATPTSQAMVKASSTIPIIFAAVTDPVTAALVADVDVPDANVSGVSDMLPLEPHLELLKELVPEAKTIGLLYNAGETNSVSLVEKEKAAAEALGLQVVEATAANSSEVLAAAQSLVGRVDAISILTDNTVVSALDSVVKVCEDNKIPLIAGDIDSVKGGAVAAYAFDYYDHGVQAGKMAVKVLEGTPIAELPVEFAENLKLALNTAAAEAMGVTIPDALKSAADETFTGAE